MKGFRLHPLLLGAICGGTLLSALCGTGCRPETPKAGTPDVIVLHTGRLRGNVYPPGAAVAVPLQNSSRLAGYIAGVREEALRIGACVVVIDLGDSLSGSFAAHVTRGRNMIEFFNAAGYDAVCLGNLDAGLDAGVLAQLEAQVLTPFVNTAGQPVPPSARAAAQISLGEKGSALLLSNFYGDVHPDSAPLRFPSWFMNEKQGVRPLRDHETAAASFGGANANAPQLRLFAWMKFEAAEHPPHDFLARLRAMGVDAVLAHRIYGNAARDVWVSQSFLDWDPPVSQNILRENRGFTVSRLDLKRETAEAHVHNDPVQTARWRVLGHQLVAMNDPSIAPDIAMEQRLMPLAEEIRRADTVLNTLAEPMNRGQILERVVAALGGVEGTHLVAYSIESIRADLPAGPLRASQLFEALPWTGEVVRLRVSQEQLNSLANLDFVRLFRRTGAPRALEVFNVVTSRFYATWIASLLHLKADALEIVATSEFDFLRDAFREIGVAQGEPATLLWKADDR